MYLAKTFYLERQGWRVELQRPPNCQSEQWKPTRSPAHVQVSFEVGPLGGAADINRSIPSSPPHPPAPGSTANAASSWMSTLADETVTKWSGLKSSATSQKKSAGKRGTHITARRTADTKDSFPVVTDWVNITTHHRHDSHPTVLRLQVSHRCRDGKYWLSSTGRFYEAEQCFSKATAAI